MAVFLNPELADAHGLVAIGGDLHPGRVLDAYRRGIFPWYEDGYPVCWWSPDPRAVFDLDRFHVPRRLSRTVRSGRFTFTLNRACGEVIRACADREEGTWITGDMIRAYDELHRQGHVHSVEAWQDGELAGGIYGVALGAMFAGESMFTRITDGSKAALVFLAGHLRQRGYRLFDIQMVTPHTAQFNPVLMTRTEYLRRLRHALGSPVTFLD